MKKLFSIIALLTLSVGLWAENSVFTYTATKKLTDVFTYYGTVISHDWDETTGNGTVTYDGEVTYISFNEMNFGGFHECSELQSITLPGVTSIGGAAIWGCEHLQAITLPDVTYIGGAAFEGCVELQSVNMPKIVNIDAGAFDFCGSLQSITFPATLETIGKMAFYGSGLQTIICEATTPPTCGEECFPSANIVVYVPAGSVDAYKAADGWKDIDNITGSAPITVDYKAAAIAEIEFAIVGVTDTDILGVANTAETQIDEAATEEVVISIKTFALTKINALVLIQTTRQGIQNTEINEMIDGAFNDILRGGPNATPGIEEIKNQILTIIQSFQIGKEEGLAEVAEALGTMGEECTDCHAVEVTKGDKTITLYAPDKVKYIKVE